MSLSFPSSLPFFLFPPLMLCLTCRKKPNIFVFRISMRLWIKTIAGIRRLPVSNCAFLLFYGIQVPSWRSDEDFEAALKKAGLL